MRRPRAPIRKRACRAAESDGRGARSVTAVAPPPGIPCDRLAIVVGAAARQDVPRTRGASRS